MGIIHLIALTIGVAVVMRFGGDWSWLRHFRRYDPQSWYFALFVVVGSCGVASLVLTAWRRFQRAHSQQAISFPSQPGHWLLLWGGAYWICQQVSFAIHVQVRLGLDPSRRELATNPELHLPYVSMVAMLLPLALVAWSLYLFWSDRYYRRYASLTLVFYGLLAVSQLADQTSDYRIYAGLALLGLINLAALVIVTIRSWHERRKYDFLHWLGLLLRLVEDGLVIFLMATWSLAMFAGRTWF
jgi:hypothetical protein